MHCGPWSLLWCGLLEWANLMITCTLCDYLWCWLGLGESFCADVLIWSFRWSRTVRSSGCCLDFIKAEESLCLMSWQKFLFLFSCSAEWPKRSSHLGEDQHSLIPIIPWAPTLKQPWRHGNAGAEGMACPSSSAASRAVTTQRSPTVCGRTSPCRPWSRRCPSPAMTSWTPCSQSWW